MLMKINEIEEENCEQSVQVALITYMYIYPLKRNQVSKKYETGYIAKYLGM